MSIQCLKKKGVIQYGSKRSGKPPGGIWISRGPSGSLAPGFVGFSIEGASRNVGYVGKTYSFSKQGTPFYGQFAKGHGGHLGKYKTAEPLFNSSEASVLGDQYKYVKPSVLSNKGMLATKYRWISSGQYPNIWVQPTYSSGPMEDNASQLLYIQKKAAANICVNNTNKPEIFVDYKKQCGKVGCYTTPARGDYFTATSNGTSYTKDLGISIDAGQYTTQIQRPCANPVGSQKPFPFAVNNSNGLSRKSVTGPPPEILTEYYLTPPAWYTK
jgi:hypothetical protein